MGRTSGVPPAPGSSAPAPCSPNNSRSPASYTSLTASSSAAPAFPHPWWRGSPVPPARTLVRQEVPDLPQALPPPSLLPHLRPQYLLLGLPPRALLEEVLPSLVWVPAPPTLQGGRILRPVEVLPGQAVPRLDLVEPRSESLGATSHRAIGLLVLRHAVLRSGGPASRPLPCRHPPLLGGHPLVLARDLGRGIARVSTRSE